MRLLPLLVLIASQTVSAATEPERSAPLSTAVDSSSTTLTVTDKNKARQWGLSDTEWQRFEELRSGPRGTWSPNLDPLTTLGVSAKTDQERRRYAEALVRQEKQRVEGELAFQKAYDEAFARLTPNLLPISEKPVGLMGTPAPGVRLAVFVSDECSPCNSLVERLINQDQPMDIYVVGSKGDDARIRAWAKTAGIPPHKVRSRSITLNHDSGQWFGLAGLGGVLPGVYTRESDQWLAVKP